MKRCQQHEGCDLPHYGRGLCVKHWRRASRSDQLANEVRCLACGAWWDRDAPDTPRFVAEHPCFGGDR